MRWSSMTYGSPTTRAPRASVYQSIAARASRTARYGVSWDIRRPLRFLALGPVDRRDHRPQRRADDVRVDADTPQDALADGALDVGGGAGVAPGGQRVLRVVQDADVDVE